MTVTVSFRFTAKSPERLLDEAFFQQSTVTLSFNVTHDTTARPSDEGIISAAFSLQLFVTFHFFFNSSCNGFFALQRKQRPDIR
jgi:hypothetical protein